MTTVDTGASARTAAADRPPATRPRRRGKWKRHVLPVWSWVVIVWLFIPIFTMIVYGFNDNPNRINFAWKGFTLRWYREMFAIDDLTTALVNSLSIAVIVTIISTVLGMFIGLALGRYKFRGSGSVNLLMFMNIAAPEVVLGASLLSLFLTAGIPRGYLTIVLAHVMFSLAYVAITVRARVAGADPSLEEAARDLGAGPITTFWKVTLPTIMPGVMAGALLAFALSVDDFIITNFNNGSTLTFPIWVYQQARKTGGSVPQQVNVMGTMIFFFGIALAVAGAVYNRRKKV